MTMLVQLLFLTLSAASHSRSQHASSSKCEYTGKIKFCHGIGWNFSVFPNPLLPEIHHLDDAELALNQFNALTKIRCDPYVRYFLCGVYTPMCPRMEGLDLILPCRSMCDSVKKSCTPLLSVFGFSWPDFLDCKRLPSASEAVCMAPENVPVDIDSSPTTAIKHQNATHSLRQACENDKQKRFVFTKDAGKERCSTLCQADVAFSRWGKTFAGSWITVWAVVCLISTMLIVTTFLIDSSRFQYPERSIAFIALSFFFIACGYLITAVVGRSKIGCEQVVPSSQTVVALEDGMTNVGCTVVFVLTYFFLIASSMWWMVLSCTWFLSAGLQWSREALNRYSTSYHFISWVVPVLLVIIAMVGRKVDVDELSAVCFIGSRVSSNALWFVTVPVATTLLIGASALLAGFIALHRVKRELQQKRHFEVQKMEKLMVRIGVYGVLYVAPTSFVVGCLVHEYLRLEKIENVHPAVCLAQADCAKMLAANEAVHYMKHFMLLVVGVTTGIWIWTKKTWRSWKRFLSSCCCSSPQNAHTGSAAGSKGTPVDMGYTHSRYTPLIRPPTVMSPHMSQPYDYPQSQPMTPHTPGYYNPRSPGGAMIFSAVRPNGSSSSRTAASVFSFPSSAGP